MLDPNPLFRSRFGLAVGVALIGLPVLPFATLADEAPGRTAEQTRQLSEEVERFNESGGALKQGRNADAEAQALDRQGPSGTSETAQGLSEEIDAYNSSGGSMNATVPTRAGTEDSTDAPISTGDRHDHSKADALSRELDQHNKNR